MRRSIHGVLLLVSLFAAIPVEGPVAHAAQPPVYPCTIEGEAARCGDIPVPENYGEQGGRRIALRAVVLGGGNRGEGARANLCDSPRQLPTNHCHAVLTREYQSDSSSLPLGRLDSLAYEQILWRTNNAPRRMAHRPARGSEVTIDLVKRTAHA
jgi:hypothetical protein